MQKTAYEYYLLTKYNIL